MEKITIIAQKEVELEDGTVFTPYKAVWDGGKLVDCRFKQSVDKSAFADMKKFEVECEVSDATGKYEYPRIYIDNIASIKKIY